MLGVTFCSFCCLCVLISAEVVYWQHYLVVAWLVPRETAAVSAKVLCTPHNHAPVDRVTLFSHIGRVYVCLAVTCLLHFWQNDRDLLRATTVTRGGTDTNRRVSPESTPWKKCKHIKGSKERYLLGKNTTLAVIPVSDYYYFHPGEENSPAVPAGARTRDLSITSQAFWPLSYLARSLFKIPLAVPTFLHTPATAVLSHSSKLLLKPLSLLCLLWAALTFSQALDAVFDSFFCCWRLHWLTDDLREWGVERLGERGKRGAEILCMCVHVCGGGGGIEWDIWCIIKLGRALL